MEEKRDVVSFIERVAKALPAEAKDIAKSGDSETETIFTLKAAEIGIALSTLADAMKDDDRSAEDTAHSIMVRCMFASAIGNLCLM